MEEGEGLVSRLPCHMTDWSFAHARPERDRARARVAQYVREAQISFLIEQMSGTSGKIISIK